TRQLVYEAESLAADIALDRSPDSTRTTLLGQLMRINEPHIPMNGVPVVLKSRKGPLGVRMTNEVGEFVFKFQNERSVSLEVEVSPNDWVLIISPPLDRKSTRLNSSHGSVSYAVLCLKKKRTG